MKTNKKQYKGILNEAISYKGPSVYLLSEQGFEEDFKQQHIARQKALYNHYSLQFDPLKNGHLLAMKLAEEHVQGFKFNTETKRKRGRPAQWLGKFGFIFYLQVQIKLHKKNRSLRNVIMIVANSMCDCELQSAHTRYHQEVLKKNSLVRMFKPLFERIPQHQRLEAFKTVLECFGSTDNGF